MPFSLFRFSLGVLAFLVGLRAQASAHPVMQGPGTELCGTYIQAQAEALPRFAFVAQRKHDSFRHWALGFVSGFNTMSEETSDLLEDTDTGPEKFLFDIARECMSDKTQLYSEATLKVIRRLLQNPVKN